MYWHVFLSLPMFAHSAHFYFFRDAQPQRLHSGTLRAVFVLSGGGNRVMSLISWAHLNEFQLKNKRIYLILINFFRMIIYIIFNTSPFSHMQVGRASLKIYKYIIFAYNVIFSYDLENLKKIMINIYQKHNFFILMISGILKEILSLLYDVSYTPPTWISPPQILQL